MKGIILAGGTGTRLYPITLAVGKQLMPIYDKPMIYYPLSTLISGGIREILIISTPEDRPKFEQLLGNGEQLGCDFSYATQDRPQGLAQAYVIGADFIGDDDVAMILGDNLFHGSQVQELLKRHAKVQGAVGFATQVKDPERYGVYEFDKDMNVISVEEKPQEPKSNYVLAGLFLSDSRVVNIARNVKPSERGELEITSVLDAYLQDNSLKVALLDRDTAWLDTGTFESMNQAAQYVQVIEQRQGVKIGCIEEAAFRQGFINASQLETIANRLTKSGYGQYLNDILSVSRA